MVDEEDFNDLDESEPKTNGKPVIIVPWRDLPAAVARRKNDWTHVSDPKQRGRLASLTLNIYTLAQRSRD